MTYEQLIAYYNESSDAFRADEFEVRCALLRDNPNMTNREATEIAIRGMIANQL